MEIITYKSVGKIKFGVSQTDVITEMGYQYKPFMKTLQSKMPTDNFTGKGIHVYYDQSGNCEAVELFSPAVPTLHGRSLINSSFRDSWAYLQNQDFNMELDENGCVSKVLGINLYAPNWREDPNALVKAVLVFSSNYYG